MFRKRKEEDPPLDRLLNDYSATRPPSSPHLAVAQIRCRRCARPTIFDNRHSRPRRCLWCNSVL
jgi:hypothetical protein